MDKIYLGAFSFFKWLVDVLPYGVLNPILKSIAFLFYMIDKKHRKIIKANLDLAFENEMSEERKQAIVKKCYDNFVFNLADFVRNQGISKEALDAKMTLKNSEVLEKAIEDQRKIIIISGHYSSWELLPLTTAAFFGPVTVVGRELDSPSLNQILIKNREQFNIEMLNKRRAMKGMINALKNDRILGILVDQNTTDQEGLLVDFFGKKAMHTPSAALLARRMDAVIIPAFITTDDYQNYTMTFYEPIEVEKTEESKQDIFEATQKLAQVTEEVIRDRPQEWFWFHKRWKNRYKEIYA